MKGVQGDASAREGGAGGSYCPGMRVQIVPVTTKGVPGVPNVKEKGGHRVGTLRMGVQGVHGVEERGRGWEEGMEVQRLPGSGKRGMMGKGGLEFQGIPGSREKGRSGSWERWDGQERTWKEAPTLGKTTEPSGMAVTVTSEASRVAR